MRRLFETDWAAAIKEHALDGLICACQHLDATSPEGRDEVLRVKEELWRHHKLIYGAFDHFANRISELSMDQCARPNSTQTSIPTPPTL